jgi:hypothetical protein
MISIARQYIAITLFAQRSVSQYELAFARNAVRGCRPHASDCDLVTVIDAGPLPRSEERAAGAGLQTSRAIP